jgi:DNA-binding transcriptional ArsR family regulator
MIGMRRGKAMDRGMVFDCPHTADLTGRPHLHNLPVMQPSGYGQLSPARLDVTFAALADPTRRAILARLAAGDASVRELAEPFSMSQAAISKHLKVLERAGLVSPGRDAQRRPRRLEAAPLAEANEWLERYRQFWEDSYGRLDVLLAEMKQTATKRPAGARRATTKRKGR